MSELTAADLMDRMYRRQRHIYDATRKYYLLGRDRLISRLNPRPEARILEIGCGTGRNLILAARRYPTARLHGVDVSTEMLAFAERAVARAGLSARVSVAHADAAALVPSDLFGTAAFERVFISYTLSMIPNWPAVLDRAIDALAPGGELHIVDFGGQERLPRAFRWLLRRWLALFDVTPCEALASELAARAAPHDAFVLVDRPYRGYAQYAIARLPVTGTLGARYEPCQPRVWALTPASLSAPSA
jgi:S-adenosylmethionine-diacylgycerolhomoserine-N-methlytransferase